MIHDTAKNGGAGSGAKMLTRLAFDPLLAYARMSGSAELVVDGAGIRTSMRVDGGALVSEMTFEDNITSSRLDDVLHWDRWLKTPRAVSHSNCRHCRCSNHNKYTKYNEVFNSLPTWPMNDQGMLCTRRALLFRLNSTTQQT